MFRPRSRPATHPSFGRRFSNKVSSLVARFEALSSPSTDSKKLSFEPPPIRSIESVISTAGVISKEDLSKQVLSHRASQVFQELDSKGHNKENDADIAVARKAPPPRRLLTTSVAHRRLRSVRSKISYGNLRIKTSGLLRRTRSTSSVSALSSQEVTLNTSNTTLGTIDGLSSGNILLDGATSTDNVAGNLDGSRDGGRTMSSELSRSVSSSDTPPVAKVLPSSFFAQLVRGNHQSPIKRSKLPTVLLNRDDEDLLLEKEDKIDYRKFRLGKPSTYNKRQSIWSRNITPPKISVKELASRFVQPEVSQCQTKIQDDAIQKSYKKKATPPPDTPLVTKKITVMGSSEDVTLNDELGVLLADSEDSTPEETSSSDTQDSYPVKPVSAGPAPATVTLTTTYPSSEESPGDNYKLPDHPSTSTNPHGALASVQSTLVSATSSLRTIFGSRAAVRIPPALPYSAPESQTRRGNKVSPAGQVVTRSFPSRLRSQSSRKSIVKTNLKTLVTKGSFYSSSTNAIKKKVSAMSVGKSYRKTPPPVEFFESPGRKRGRSIKEKC